MVHLKPQWEANWERRRGPYLQSLRPSLTHWIYFGHYLLINQAVLAIAESIVSYPSPAVLLFAKLFEDATKKN